MAGLAVIATGCGTHESPKEKVAQSSLETAETPVSTESVASSLPESVIIRMPLDAQGNPTGVPEMRLVQSSESLTSPEAVAAAFASGSTPAKLVSSLDELDQDSSTQAWYWHRTGWGHWGGGWGGWNRFNPGFGWHGQHWNFGFANNWNWNGYGYGCFNRGWR